MGVPTEPAQGQDNDKQVYVRPNSDVTDEGPIGVLD